MEPRVSGVLIAVLIVISSFASGYMYSSKKWSSIVEEKEDTISRLTSTLNSTREELGRLRVKYEDLSMERDNLSLSVKLLEREVENLSLQKSILEKNLSLALKEVALKRGETENLTRLLKEAYSKVNKLKEEAIRANETIGKLEYNMEKLKQKLSYINTTLIELNETLENITTWYWLAPDSIEYSFLDAVLAESYNEVEEEAGNLSSVNADAGYKVLAVMEYVVLNTYYQWDHYARLYDPWNRSVVSWNDMISMPNETMGAEGGDCEDLAVYAYALLSSLGGFDRLYLLMWFNESVGHVAVLAVADDGYYILDPAGDYVNGYTILLELKVEDYSMGDKWYYYISPLSMEPTVKHNLLENELARIVYMNTSNNAKYYSKPGIEAYSNPSNLLDDWISYWGVKPVRLEIHSVGIHESFNTTADLASWLEGGG